VYQKFFGTQKKPFSIAPDPFFMYMSEGHREALAHLRYGLENNGGFVLLTGEVGAGKTTVCRCLLEHIPDDANIAFIINPKLSPLELLATICDEFGINFENNASIKDLIDAINEYLLTEHSQGRHTVLIIDEAQNLSVEVLEQIRLLTNLETNEQKLLQIIMLGQPELQEKLAREDLKQLAQRISARYHLGPLSYAEIKAYVRHRLSVAGMSPQIFTEGSLKKLYFLSSGIPRLVNIICDRALLGAYTKGVQTVDIRMMSAAGSEVFGGKLKNKALRLVSPWLVAAATIMVCGTVLVLLNLTPLPGHQPLKKAMDAAVLSVNRHAAESKEIKQASSAIPVLWPTNERAGQSEELAMQTLLHIWGLPGFSPGEAWGCQYAESQGLRCMAGKTGLAGLLRLNRPAILRMRNDRQQEFFMVLAAEHGERLELRLGKEVVVVNAADLALRWSGRYVLFWRPPPGYSGSIRPGYRGREVNWLAEQLALVGGEEYNDRGAKAVFNSRMVEQIKKIQFSHNFIPDGIVGKETIILLNTLTGTKVPLLHSLGA